MEVNKNTTNVAILGFYIFFKQCNMVAWLFEHGGGKEKEIKQPKLHKQIFTQKEKKVKK